jgi:hypothetical protein
MTVMRDTIEFRRIGVICNIYKYVIICYAITAYRKYLNMIVRLFNDKLYSSQLTENS